MNINKLLETIKDTSRDYVGMNGCLYQDITREELDLIVNEIERLNNRIDKAIETINLMIYKGYTISNKGTARSYMATGKYSEFGIRAKELLDILKGSDKNV